MSLRLLSSIQEEEYDIECVEGFKKELDKSNTEEQLKYIERTCRLMHELVSKRLNWPKTLHVIINEKIKENYNLVMWKLENPAYPDLLRRIGIDNEFQPMSCFNKCGSIITSNNLSEFIIDRNIPIETINDLIKEAIFEITRRIIYNEIDEKDEKLINIVKVFRSTCLAGKNLSSFEVREELFKKISMIFIKFSLNLPFDFFSSDNWHKMIEDMKEPEISNLKEVYIAKLDEDRKRIIFILDRMMNKEKYLDDVYGSGNAIRCKSCHEKFKEKAVKFENFKGRYI